MCEDCIIGDYEEYCKCKLSGDICPYVRRCTTNRVWLPLDSMPHCILEKEKNHGNVRFEKKGYLYIDTVDGVVKVKNPFNFVPNNVKVIKNKGEWVIANE